MCHHGANCAYRHEYRHIDQIHRYYYVNKLITKEVLHQRFPVEANLARKSDSGVKRLKIFENIQALGEKEHCKEQSPSQISEDSYQDYMERTLGSSNDGATESVEDFNENGENIELDLSLGDIPNVD